VIDDTKPSISEYLESLGNTADAVARSLMLQGVVGVRGNTRSCPLVVGINRHCNAWSGLQADGDGNLRYNDCQIMDPRNTDAGREFVKAFDRGKYRSLIRRGSEKTG
jgi:hypothetical protein